VFFNEHWVPYDERADYLLDADVGVSCHLDHIETEFSFRTRILDYLWAGLPIVCTDGDSFGELVRAEGLGRTVPAGDVGALAEALIDLLSDAEALRQTSARVTMTATRFTWASTLDPLLRFARSPRRAPDLVAAKGAARLSTTRVTPVPKDFDAKHDLALARAYLRDGGVGELARRMGGRLRRVTGEHFGST
jgi:hypothetical protein